MVRPIDSGGYIHHAPRVHFSPVVSQLRYREQQGILRPIKKQQSSNSGQSKAENSSTGHEKSSAQQAHTNERVTVQVQEVIVPPLPPVQKVQVTVPSTPHVRTYNSDRYTLEANVPQQPTCSTSKKSIVNMMDHPQETINTIKGDDASYGKNNKQSHFTSHSRGFAPYSHGATFVVNGNYSHPGESLASNGMSYYSHAGSSSTLNGNYTHSGRLTPAGNYAHTASLQAPNNGNCSHTESLAQNNGNYSHSGNYLNSQQHLPQKGNYLNSESADLKNGPYTGALKNSSHAPSIFVDADYGSLPLNGSYYLDNNRTNPKKNDNSGGDGESSGYSENNPQKIQYGYEYYGYGYGLPSPWNRQHHPWIPAPSPSISCLHSHDPAGHFRNSDPVGRFSNNDNADPFLNKDTAGHFSPNGPLGHFGNKDATCHFGNKDAIGHFDNNDAAGHFDTKGSGGHFGNSDPEGHFCNKNPPPNEINRVHHPQKRRTLPMTPSCHQSTCYANNANAFQTPANVEQRNEDINYAPLCLTHGMIAPRFVKSSSTSAAAAAPPSQSQSQTTYVSSSNSIINSLTETNDNNYFYPNPVKKCPTKREQKENKIKVNKKGNTSTTSAQSNSKFSFFRRFAIGRLVKHSSKSKSKSLSNYSGVVTPSSQVVVPVSSWPVHSITTTEVVDVEPDDSIDSPINSSCSTCGEFLVEGSTTTGSNKKKSRSLKGKSRSSAGTTATAATVGSRKEDNTGISSNSHQQLSKAITNGLNVNLSHPYSVVTSADNTLWISREGEKCCREERTRFRSSSVAALKPNENLVSSNIPTTDTWDPQTADQIHFVKVENERKASAGEPISHVEIPSSSTNYQSNTECCERIKSSEVESKAAGEGVKEEANNSRSKNVKCISNKNAATSPIHHLSAFYALNLPIVPPTYPSRRSPEEDGEAPPVPKPRTKRQRRKGSVAEYYSSETDELSANVDRILDEIAGLELECMKMERKGSFLEGEYLHDGDNKENEQRFARSQSPVWETERLRVGIPNHRPRHHEKVGLSGKPPLPPSAKSTAACRQNFLSNYQQGDSRLFGTPGMSGTDFDVKVLKFRVQLYRSREELAKSHPDLKEIEDSVRSSMVIDRSSKQRTLPLSLCRGSENPETSSGYTPTHVSGQIHRHTPDPVTIEKERCTAKEWSNLYSKVKENFLRSPPSNNNRHGNTSGPLYSTGIVETDLDTGASREIVGGEKQFKSYGQQHEWTTNDQGNISRDDIKSKNLPLSVFPDDGRLCFSLNFNQKTQSMLNLGSPTSTMSHKEKSATIASTSSAKGAESGTCSLSVASSSQDERARSMEFLLEDSDKNAHLRPPENNLMRQENRQLSEHELRIQRSLNKLNVPDWYKSYSTGDGSRGGGGASTGGSAAGSKGKIFGSGSGLAGGWSGLSTSKTSSLTSLQSTGRTHFSRLRSTGTASTGARSSRESLMSPSSTASASPSPYYERSSFTYGMPYALTRFASARMSCGASPASLSPSPSPVGGVGGSATSTPVSSAPLSRHHSYSKAPYLGWRSQERLTSKTMYRSPAERMTQDLLAQKPKTSATSSTASTPKETEKDLSEITLEVSSPKKETVSTSELSLNNSEESNSHKLNRVRSSIKEVSNAIVDYVNESKPLDDGINGGTSPRRGFVWLESSFVGTKPIDSPGTPDTPAMFMAANRQLPVHESDSSSMGIPRHVFRFDEEHSRGIMEPGLPRTSPPTTNTTDSAALANTSNGSSTTYTPYHSRNEQMEERSNSSSVSSPTLEDILDSLLALRRPHKKIRARSGKGHSREPAPIPPPHLDPTPVSDWQERMNQPVLDTAYFPINDDFFATTTVTTATVTTSNIPSANNYCSDSYTNIETLPSYTNDDNVVEEDNVGGDVDDDAPVETYNFTTSVMYTGSNGDQMRSMTTTIRSSTKVPEPVAVIVEEASTRPGEDVVDKDENAFGIPTEICTATSSAISAVNPLASLNDSSNPPTPARHRRVSFDLDISDKEEKSSSRSNRRDESVGGTIHCRNSKCAKSASGLEARREFKTCHNCNAYYCSRECRRAHWDKHKKVCMQSRVGALCKQIINHVKEDSFVVSQLSAVARRGFLAKGRGCVKLFFSSPDRAERFLTGGLPELPEPWYIPSGDILPEEMGAQTFTELSEQCRSYNGDNRFVLYVSVCVVNEVPTSGAVKWEREMISRSSKIRLLLPRNYDENQMHHHAASAAHLFPEEPHVPAYHHEADSNPGAQENLPPLPPPPPNGSQNETLILRSVPALPSHQLSRSDHKKLREVSFANIQKHLLERGVDLRRTYPDIYSKLCNYVEHDEPFLPVTIYPKNSNTGGQFVCVIMPESSDSTLEDYSSRGDKVETVNISEHSSYDLC